MDRHRLFHGSGKDTKKSDRVPLIMTYNPANPDMKKIIDKHWNILQLCNKKEAFKEKPLISYRRNRNLTDRLVRAKCKRPIQNHTPRKNPNLGKCKTPWNCRFCPKRDRNRHFQSSSTGRNYRSPEYTCNTRNVVYLITCTKCKIQYIGESYRPFRERMAEHERYVKNRKFDQATGAHFNQRGHSVGHMKYEVIYCLWKKPEPNDPVRIGHEIRMMEQLQTFKPKGLNDKGK